MSTGLKILINRTFGLLLAANAINITAQWSVLALLTKFGLFEALGTFSLALAFISPILVLASSQIKTFVASDVENAYPITIYLNVRLLLFLISLIIAVLFCAFFYYEYLIPFTLFLIAKSIENLSDVCYGERLRKNENNFIAISYITRGIIGWVGMSIIVTSTKNLNLGLLYLCIINMLLFKFYDLPKQAVDILNILSISEYKRIISRLIPLGIITTLNSLTSNIPRLYIEKYWGLKQLGIYTNLSYVWLGAGYVAFTLGDSLINKVAHSLKNGNPEILNQIFKTLFYIFIFSLLILIVYVFFWGELTLRILYDNSTAKNNDTFLYIICLIPFSIVYPVIMNTLTSMKLFKIQLIIHFIYFSFTVIFSSSVIPKYGIKGAAISQLLGSILLTVLGYFFVWKNRNASK